MFSRIRSKPLGRIFHFFIAPPRTFLNFWAADLVKKLSLPIPGWAGTFDFYLIQRNSRMKASPGWGDFSTENLIQSLGMIARQGDILSRNRREFWAVES